MLKDSPPVRVELTPLQVETEESNVDVEVDFDAARRDPPAIVRYTCLVIGICSQATLWWLIDVSGAIHSHLREYFEEMSTDNYEWMFNAMFIAYGVPSLFTAIFGGLLVDKYGPFPTLLVSGIICVLGGGISVCGVVFKLEAVVLLGRVVVGIAAETQFTSSIALCSILFEHLGEGGTALGLVASADGMGSLLGFSLTPIVAERTSVVFAVAVPPLLMVPVLVVAAGVYLGTPREYWAVEDSSQLQTRFLDESPVNFAAVDSNSDSAVPSSETDGEISNSLRSLSLDETEHKRPTCSQLRALPGLFWGILVCSFLATNTTFLHIGAAYASTIGSDTPGATPAVGMLVYVLISPLAGLLIDYTAARYSVFLLGASLALATHVITYLDAAPPVVPFVLSGASTGMTMVSIYEACSLIVSQHHIGLALGLITAVLSLEVAIMPALVSLYRSETNSYAHIGTVFLPLACMYFVGVVVIILCDIRLYGRSLQRRPL